jgi:glycosyltransferase involved in cell wall biosynthesis
VNVLYVYHGDWPRNATRPVKQTRALAQAGHKVHLLSANPLGKPRFMQDEWLSVERLPSFGSAKRHRILGFPVFANPVWIAAIWRAARRCHADCIIVVDLPLAAAAIAVGSALDIPVHFDVADVHAVGMRDSYLEHAGLVAKLTRNPAIAESIERFVLTHVASTFVVSEEIRERCIAIGVAPERVVLVGNTPENVDDLHRHHPIPHDIADWAGRPLMVFVGNLLPSRGLSLAIDATNIARRDVADVGFVIVGDGREEPALHRQIRALGLDGHVRLVGWKAPAEHPAYLAHATVGVLPFLPTQHISITLANKLFDYMGASLPVLASDVPSMRRIVAGTGCGLLVAPKDATALATGLVTLLQDPELRERMGRNGRAAVETTYAWAEDRRRFVDAIERYTAEFRTLPRDRSFRMRQRSA